MEELIKEYISLNKQAKETEERINQIRNIWAGKLEADYKDDDINIYFKETKVFKYPDATEVKKKELQKQIKEMQEEDLKNGKAKLEKINRVLNVIIYNK